METLVKKLYEVEGGIFHINKGEKDITSPAGVYKYSNPTADLWKYVDTIIDNFGLTKSTKDFTKADFDTINDLVKNEPVVKKDIFNLEVKFYIKYIKHLRIHLFDNLLKYTVFNLYTNSHIGLWKSVQYGIRKLIENNILDYDINKTSIVDGKFGKKTADALTVVKKELPEDKQEIFRQYILDGMENYYIKLSSYPNYKKYRNGWLNRVKHLRSI